MFEVFLQFLITYFNLRTDWAPSLGSLCASPNEVSFAWSYYIYIFHNVPATNTVLRGFCFINHLRVTYLELYQWEGSRACSCRNIRYLKINTNLDLQHVCLQCCVCGEVPELLHVLSIYSNISTNEKQKAKHSLTKDWAAPSTWQEYFK